jgi:hypothetical protein
MVHNVPIMVGSGVVPVGSGQHTVTMSCGSTYSAGFDPVQVVFGQVQAVATSSAATPPGFSTNQTIIKGNTYQQVWSTQVTQPLGPGRGNPFVAYGTTTATLQGDNEWDTVSCYLTLDGTPIGYDQKVALSTEPVDGANDPAAVPHRELTLVGSTRLTAAGQHTLAMVCAVSSGSDAVAIGGTSLVGLAEPQSNSVVGAVQSISGPAFQTVATANFTEPMGGGEPIAVIGTATAKLTGGNEWDTVACRIVLDGQVIGDGQWIDLTTQHVVYNDYTSTGPFGGKVYNWSSDDMHLDSGTIGVGGVGTPPSVPQGHLAQLQCQVNLGSDTVQIVNPQLLYVLTSPAS